MPEIVINKSLRFVFRDSEADRGVVNQIFGSQDYSIERLRRCDELMQHYRALVEAGRPIIVDCGANIGASAVYFALKFPEAAIVAIEPDAENCELCRQNTSTFPNVRCVEAAVAGRSGEVMLTDPGGGEWAYRTNSEVSPGASVRNVVPAVTVASIVHEYADARPFILKVDIEGAEADLFSATDSCPDFPLVIIELHDWMLPKQGTSRGFLEWHLRTPRDLVQIGENTFSIAHQLQAPTP